VLERLARTREEVCYLKFIPVQFNYLLPEIHSSSIQLFVNVLHIVSESTHIHTYTFRYLQRTQIGKSLNYNLHQAGRSV
jgi:hypothetical protein